MDRRLRFALIGGGPGSFIGAVHRIAAELDGCATLVAGAFSSDPAKSAQAGATYRIDPARAYSDITTLIGAERAREDGIDFLIVATPNHLHLPMCHAALDAGIPVMTDKPVTATLAEAHQLRDLVRRCALPFGVTYTYSGYPLVRHARALIAQGDMGAVRKIVVEYPQGWLAQPIERNGDKQAGWRTDPARSGAGGCIGDIGVHAFHLAEFVTGLRATSLLADLVTVVPGRRLDDDCTVLLRFDNGARGVLMASQIAIGELNGLRIRVYGERGAIDWRQEEPNVLLRHHADGRSEWVRAGDSGLQPAALSATRLPGGHPEGYLEAFANLYRDFYAHLDGQSDTPLPGIDDGLRSMAFIEASVAASRADSGWVRFDGETA